MEFSKPEKRKFEVSPEKKSLFLPDNKTKQCLVILKCKVAFVYLRKEASLIARIWGHFNYIN